jgi:hypothetical protein
MVDMKKVPNIRAHLTKHSSPGDLKTRNSEPLAYEKRLGKVTAQITVNWS